jgi:ferric-dicitrate binding protein FerR (iron transport regulator)
MEQHDEQLESFLCEFQPRRPRALPTAAPAPDRTRRAAAGAAAALALAASLWLALRQRAPQPVELTVRTAATSAARPAPLPIFVLTQLAVNDSSRFDAALDDASRRSLPNFRGNSSALKVLAKE